MIKRRKEVIALVVMIFVTLTACSESGSGDYCDNHYEYHADHIDAVASLLIELSEAGVLDGQLLIPNSAFDNLPPLDVETIFASAENTFTLQSEIPCNVAVTEFKWINDIFEVRYAASCGTNNKIGKIDVALFDHVNGLEEVVTSVTTPATAKRFGISRQCDAPIFRLDKLHR